jgi:hypothetical protein
MKKPCNVKPRVPSIFLKMDGTLGYPRNSLPALNNTNIHFNKC